MSFTFDDVPASAYTNGAAVLEDHGVHGTFYIAAGTLGDMDTDWRVIDREQVRALHARGHEIGCHTYSHVGVDTLDAVTMDEECRQNRGFLARALRRRRSDQLLLPVRPRVTAAQAAARRPL